MTVSLIAHTECNTLWGKKNWPNWKVFIPTSVFDSQLVWPVWPEFSPSPTANQPSSPGFQLCLIIMSLQYPVWWLIDRYLNFEDQFFVSCLRSHPVGRRMTLNSNFSRLLCREQKRSPQLRVCYATDRRDDWRTRTECLAAVPGGRGHSSRASVGKSSSFWEPRSISTGTLR